MPARTTALAVFTLLLLLVAASPSSSSIHFRSSPPKPQAIHPPAEPPARTDRRTDTFRLAQILHHGVVDDHDAGPYTDEDRAAFDAGTLSKSRAFFRVMDYRAERERRMGALRDGVVVGDEEEYERFMAEDQKWSFTLSHHKGAVPVWSPVSRAKRTKAWEGAMRSLREQQSRAGLVDGDEEDGGMRIMGGMESMESRMRKLEEEFSAPVQIQHNEIRLPDMKDPGTILNVGRMTYNSYDEPGGAWMDVPGWNVTDRFGWEADGIRGYVFMNEFEDTIAIVIKGTSLQTPIGGGKTSPRDKFNTIYVAVRAWYPKTTSYWLSGHSLGGSLASLLALTHDLPGVSFEAPGDFQYASRIGLMPDLPPPPEEEGGNDTDATASSFFFDDPRGKINYDAYLDTLDIYHVGNSKDPIYLGACQGPSSSCWYAGYALESQCHSGKECIYNQEEHDKNVTLSSGQRRDAWFNGRRERRDGQHDAVGDGGMLRSFKERLDVRYHSIEMVIRTYLEKWEYVPKCEVRPNCEECTQWTWKHNGFD
ncbi:putative lipase atg15 [Irineochytrium annulatum]|nr:putative lipase atg15 [Irineochytrium annulatum]